MTKSATASRYQENSKASELANNTNKTETHKDTNDAIATNGGIARRPAPRHNTAETKATLVTEVTTPDQKVTTGDIG